MKFIINKSSVLLIILFTIYGNVISQDSFNYQLSLVPVTIPSLPGLHSYAHAQSNGKWLIIGGRKDGLHARQPFNAFPALQNNTDIYVVDIAGNQYWTASVNTLPATLKEQLQSTNMNFYQDNDTLYIIGGYGFSPTANNHITFPYLTAVNVSGLINAIQNAQPINPYFKQIQDANFAVTGGHLKKLNDRFYLVGGHRFDGRYNSMGNPTYTQSYTNQIRKFSINNSGNQLSYSNYTTVTDPVHLRRRDYNLAAQVFPDGELGMTIFSGVFQLNADLPFLYPVDINESGHIPVTTFNQYLSNYHSPVATLYDSANNNMHTIFFGGMSQYYYQNNTLVQDDQVPFVKTISRVSRNAQGQLNEYRMPVEMPSLKGASAEFIPNLALPHYENKVLKLNEIDQTSFMIGHIYGGISSTTMNPFSNNQTTATQADPSIYEVWLSKTMVGATEFPVNGKNPFDVEFFPNPFERTINMKFTLDKSTELAYIITNSLGQIIEKTPNKRFEAGTHQLKTNIVAEKSADKVIVTVVFDNKYYFTKNLVRK